MLGVCQEAVTLITYVYRLSPVEMAPGWWLDTKPLKGRHCVKVKAGPRLAILVRFEETGELVLTNVRALRKV